MGFYNCSRTLEDGGLNPIKEAARYIGENCFYYNVSWKKTNGYWDGDTVPLKMYFNTRYSYTATEGGKPCYGIIFEPFVIYPTRGSNVQEIIPLKKIVWDDVSVIHNVDSIKRRITEFLIKNEILLDLARAEHCPGSKLKAHLISLGNNPHVFSNEFSISNLEDIAEDLGFMDEEVEFIVPEEENQN